VSWANEVPGIRRHTETNKVDIIFFEFMSHLPPL